MPRAASFSTPSRAARAACLLTLLLVAALASAAPAPDLAPPSRRRLAGGGGKMYGPAVVGEAVLGTPPKHGGKVGKRAPAVVDLGGGEAAVAIPKKHVAGVTWGPDGEAVISVKGKYSPRYAAALAGTAGEAVLVKKG